MKKMLFPGLALFGLFAAIQADGQSNGAIIQSNPDHSAFYAYAENNM